MKFRRFTVNGEEGRLSVVHPSHIVPPWYAEIFQLTASAYYASASKRPPRWRTAIPAPLAKLVAEYFRHNSTAIINEPLTDRRAGIADLPASRQRVTVMFSGGKDSAHVLQRLLEKGCRPQDLQAIYITNINRSETAYEKRAAWAICRSLDVTPHVVEVNNSVKLNRTGHNIGLREQLLLGLALPWVTHFQSQRVIFGATRAFEVIQAPLYCTHRSAFELYSEFLREYGITVDIENHPDYPEVTESGILRDLIERGRALLDATSSCYTQMNFREAHHDRLQAKLPAMPLYNGCGSCLKCLRINAAILLYDPRAKAAPADQRAALARHIYTGATDRFPTDGQLADLVSGFGRAVNE
jgi:7-cyano-7-deazaguanine synthase in queuosine biosynthesis